MGRRLSDFCNRERMPIQHYPPDHPEAGYPTQQWRESMAPINQAYNILLDLEGWCYRVGLRPLAQDYTYRDKNDMRYLAQVGSLVHPFVEYIYDQLEALDYTCQDVIDLKESIVSTFDKKDRDSTDTWEYLFAKYVNQLYTSLLEAA